MTPLLNSQGKALYVLRRVSDKFVINPRAISNTTSLPNPGPDQEYLAILTDAAPDHDPSFTVRTQNEGPNEGTTPPQWEIHYDVTDRPKSEQLAAVDNARRLEVQKQFPSQDSWESMIVMVAALARKLEGLELTPAEQAANDRLVQVAAKITENIANSDDKKAAVNAGQKPDLEGGWAALPAPVVS